MDREEKQTPLVSVIVPVYKAERYLRQCIESILAQTFGDFELILIDDGSPDGSGAICDEYAAKDDRVRVFHQENRGETRTRERGVALARGTNLIWVDADDYIEPELLKETAAAHERTGADIVLYGWRELMGNQVVREYRRKQRSSEEWRRAMVTGKTGYVWNYSCRRSLWGGNIPSELERAACDGYITRHLFIRASQVAAIPGVFYNYRRDNESSITHSVTGRRLQCNAYVWHYCFPLCREHFPRDVGAFAAKGLSAAVKAYALSLHWQDLTDAEQERLTDMMREFIPYAGFRRPRDRILAWAILHGHLGLARRYAAGKLRKEQSKGKNA